MNEFEKIIKKQQELTDRLNYSGMFSAIKVLGANSFLQEMNRYQQTLTALHENESLRILRDESERISQLVEPMNQSYRAICGTLVPVLDSYNKISELTCVSRQVAELLEPLSMSTKVLQNISPALDEFSKISTLTTHVLKEPSLLTYLHEVIKSQIDTSLWDYFESLEDDEIDIDVLDEAIEIIKSPGVGEKMQAFLKEKGEAGKKILAKIVYNLFIIFISGYLTHCFEPIYKVMTPSFLRQEDNAETTELVEIPKNTEIHVWNEVTNNYIEITYQIDGQEYQGYITRKELEQNTELISGEVSLEQIVFINDIVEALAERWDASPNSTYKFLNEETNLINTYILKCYDALKLLDESEIINNLEEHCEQKGIAIPFARNNMVEEIK